MHVHFIFILHVVKAERAGEPGISAQQIGCMTLNHDNGNEVTHRLTWVTLCDLGDRSRNSPVQLNARQC